MRAGVEDIDRDRTLAILPLVDFVPPIQARLDTRAVRGEPVTAMLAEIERVSPQLVVLGKRGPEAPAAKQGAVGGVALRIAYHTAADVLMLSS
jgi:hypothetical protein